jgi:hypothetical protein
VRRRDDLVQLAQLYPHARRERRGAAAGRARLRLDRRAHFGGRALFGPRRGEFREHDLSEGPQPGGQLLAAGLGRVDDAEADLVGRRAPEPGQRRDDLAVLRQPVAQVAEALVESGQLEVDRDDEGARALLEGLLQAVGLVLVERARDLFGERRERAPHGRAAPVARVRLRQRAQPLDERLILRLGLAARGALQALRESGGRVVQRVEHGVLDGDAPQAHAVEQGLELVRDPGHGV